MSRIGLELTFRSFQGSDQDTVRGLILDGLSDRFPVIDASLNPDLNDINASYIEKGHAFLVVQMVDQIIGVGALLALEDRVGRIVRVSVAKEYRRRGIGARIVTQLVQLAQERHFQRLLVETNLDWFEAIALYRHFGFRPYDYDEVSVHMELILEDAE